MRAVLMVCLGNICRSPLAEGILKHKAKEHNFDLHIDSAATSNYNLGQNPDKRASAQAIKHGIDISNLIARQFTIADFDSFDLIYAMDNHNYNDIIKLARNQEDKKKVRMILNEVSPGMNISVTDPYFGGEQDFNKVFSLLDKACTIIISNLKKEQIKQ